MIISDKHKFAFIHIPKCAGTSVRNQLSIFDDRNGFYTGKVERHPELGMLDFVHIPLFALKSHFAEEMQNIRTYWSFAIVRDPGSRFMSSMSQHLKMYRKTPVSTMTADDLMAEICKVISFLKTLPRREYLLPPEYIHFQSQIDYLVIEGEQVINSVYRIDEVPILVRDVSRYTGIILHDNSIPHQNRAITYRNDFLRRIAEFSHPLSKRLRRVLPVPVLQGMRQQFYVPRDLRFGDLLHAQHVQDFIRDYYKEDLNLWKSLQCRT